MIRYVLGMSALMTILVYSILALPTGIYLPLCCFLSCGDTDVCVVRL